MSETPKEKPPRKKRAPAKPKAPKPPPLTPTEKEARIGPRIAALFGLEVERQFLRMPFRDMEEPPAGVMALDFETEDPTLKDIGSAWAFPGVGKIIGVAVAWADFEAYWPVAHDLDNVADPAAVMAWLKRQFERADLKIICANANYDLGWARREIGIYPAGGQCDVQHMAALLNENAMSFSLKAIAQEHLGMGKATGVIEHVVTELRITKTKVMERLRFIPGPVVGPYAATDARRTYDAYVAMLPKLEEQDLLDVLDMESRLIPMCVEMRRRGIRVDVDKANEMADDIRDNKIPAIQKQIADLCGGLIVSPWDAESIAAALRARLIEVAKTPKTNKPKVDEKTLEAAKDEAARLIIRLRKMAKIEGTFLRGHILGHVVNGRVHPQMNQLRGERDSGGSVGTVTSRFSIDSPAFQQLPVRDAEWGPQFRALVLAEIGEMIASLDYSSQEPRLMVHYAYAAKIPGAAAVVKMYNDNPRTDFHQMTADLCGIPRPPAKTINLGLGYGMGGAKLAHSLGLPTIWKKVRKVTTQVRDYSKPGGVRDEVRSVWEDIAAEDIDEPHFEQLKAEGWQLIELAGPEAKAIIQKWKEGMPFIDGLIDKVKKVAGSGYIVTLGGRRCRFPEGVGRDGEPERQGLHKALNKLIQSSAADQTKRAMLNLWDAGLVPLLPIHDELVFSVHTKEEADNLAKYMREAYTLAVPTVVDVKVGATLGDIPK